MKIVRENSSIKLLEVAPYIQRGANEFIKRLVRYDSSDPLYDNVVLLLERESYDKSKYNNQFSSNVGAGFNNGVIRSDGWTNQRILIRERTTDLLTMTGDFTLEGRWKMLSGRTANETPALLHNEGYTNPTGSAVFYYINSTGNMALVVSGGNGNNSQPMTFPTDVESEVSLTRIGGTAYWHQDGIFLAQRAIGTGPLLFANSAGASIIQRTSTANPCHVEVSRVRLTKDIGRYGPANYTVPERYYPFEESVSPLSKNMVFCFDGDVHNGLVDLTGRHNMTLVGSAGWDSANRQTTELFLNNRIDIAADANVLDFHLEGDYTIDIRAAIIQGANTADNGYATIIEPNGLWTPDTTTEALGIIWVASVHTGPQMLMRSYAGTISGMGTFWDTTRLIWANGRFNDLRFVRKNGRTRAYTNGSTAYTGDPGTFTQKIMLASTNLGLGIGARRSPQESSKIIIKKMRIVKAALNDPWDKNYRVPQRYI